MNLEDSITMLKMKKRSWTQFCVWIVNELSSRYNSKLMFTRSPKIEQRKSIPKIQFSSFIVSKFRRRDKLQTIVPALFIQEKKYWKIVKLDPWNCSLIEKNKEWQNIFELRLTKVLCLSNQILRSRKTISVEPLQT